MYYRIGLVKKINLEIIGYDLMWCDDLDFILMVKGWN